MTPEPLLEILDEEPQRTDHPRDDLYRMTPRESAKLRADETDEGDGNTLVGYAAVFDAWTEINGWEGRFVESLDPHAFNKTLKDRAGRIKVLYDHGMDPSIGNKPLGRAEVIKPDEYGLWTETPLARTSYNEDLRELLSVGAIDGMSFRMTVVRDEWNDDPKPAAHNPNRLPERRIKEVRLFEFGPVTFPAYEATTAGVRSQAAYLAWRQTHQNAEPAPVEPIVVWTEPASTTPPNMDTPPTVAPVISNRTRLDDLVASAIRRADEADRAYRRYHVR